MIVLSPPWYELGWLQSMPKDFEPVAGNVLSSVFRVRR